MGVMGVMGVMGNVVMAGCRGSFSEASLAQREASRKLPFQNAPEYKKPTFHFKATKQKMSSSSAMTKTQKKTAVTQKRVCWWDALSHSPPTTVEVANISTWIDALRARSPRDVLLGAGYSYDGPDLVARIDGTEIIVRANAVLVRCTASSPDRLVMVARPQIFSWIDDDTFEVLPHTIFGSLYYQPACEYPHGFRSLADKILKAYSFVVV